MLPDVLQGNPLGARAARRLVRGSSLQAARLVGDQIDERGAAEQVGGARNVLAQSTTVTPSGSGSRGLRRANCATATPASVNAAPPSLIAV
jgi:hypothetical protein